MTFQPVLPLGGYAGWGFLKRTMAAQQTVQQSAAVVKRDEAYFREKIGTIDTAAALVADKRLLRTALTAFGLEGDVNSGAFIRKVLEDGTLKEGTLSSKLANKQYQKLSAAFGFGDFSIPRTKLSDFPDKILAQTRTRQFETAVGTQNNTYRLALNAEREIPAIAAQSLSETGKWFTILGNPPLREMVQTALGLPKSFASIDLDQQVSVMRKRTEAAFGNDSISQFSDPKAMEALTRRFLLRADAQGVSTATTPAAMALQLLRR
jgi:Protein of unknown function (DUF1217)